MTGKKNERRKKKGTVEQRVFSGTQKLIDIRKKHKAFGDYRNIEWMTPHNIHIAGYIRALGNEKIFCIYNFSDKDAHLTWFAFREKGGLPNQQMKDLWSGQQISIGRDDQFLVLKPYQFALLEMI